MEKEEEPWYWNTEEYLRNVISKPGAKLQCIFPTRFIIDGKYKYMDPGKWYDHNIDEIIE